MTGVQTCALPIYAEARGTGDMAGDLWTISNLNDLQNVTNKCNN